MRFYVFDKAKDTKEQGNTEEDSEDLVSHTVKELKSLPAKQYLPPPNTHYL